jgi:predicted membrane protein
MLPVSLDCQFLIAPTVSFVVEFVLFVLVLCLLFPLFPVSLDCQFLIAPSVFFVLVFCCFFFCLMSFFFHVVRVSRDTLVQRRQRKPKGQSRIDNLETLATWETKDTRRGQTKQIPQQRKL